MLSIYIFFDIVLGIEGLVVKKDKSFCYYGYYVVFVVMKIYLKLCYFF